MSAEDRKSRLMILMPDGSLKDLNGYDFSKEPDLKAFCEYEDSGSREAGEAPPHIKLMQYLELVDYEPASDPGNFRWLPKGHLIKRLMESHVSQMMRRYGGMQVETPIMYDLNHPCLSAYLARFPARQYKLISGEKEFFLRFAACFGQYLIMRDMQISYNHLPLRMYELTHYSFRREQGGELAGLRRLRSFTMPDMHTLCPDNEQAKAEFFSQYLLCKQWMEGLGIGYVMALRVVRGFLEQNKEFILSIAKDFNRPILLEIWDERFFYFILKFEFNVVDSQQKAAALSTVQIDVENSERFGISYVASDGSKKHPLLLHASISGSVDRNLYALLESEARRSAEDRVPQLPYWLSPTQVMLIPVSDRHIPGCEKIAKAMEGIARVEIDDSTETLAKKIRSAEIKWVPFILVFGDKENQDGSVSVRKRGVKDRVAMTVSDFLFEAKSAQGDKPFEPINWPMMVSRQPRFR